MAQVNGHTFKCQKTTVVVTDNFPGNVGDMVQASCNSPVFLDGEKLWTGGQLGLLLATGPGVFDVILDTSLPSVLDVSRFDSVSNTYGWVTTRVSTAMGNLGATLNIDEIKTIEATPAKRQ